MSPAEAVAWFATRAASVAQSYVVPVKLGRARIAIGLGLVTVF